MSARRAMEVTFAKTRNMAGVDRDWTQRVYRQLGKAMRIIARKSVKTGEVTMPTRAQARAARVVLRDVEDFLRNSMRWRRFRPDLLNNPWGYAIAELGGISALFGGYMFASVIAGRAVKSALAETIP